MKTFLIVALLAIAVTNTSAIIEWQQQQQQPCLQQQPFFQPFLLQQLNPCKAFFQQQCSPVTLTMMVPFLCSQLLQQSSCQVMQQQCCQQLVQIPEQSRCQAICSIVHAIVMQQQQFWQGTFFHPQQQLSEGFFHPQQLAQFEAMRAMALETLPTMCNVYVPPYCCSSTISAPFGGVTTCASGACF